MLDLLLALPLLTLASYRAWRLIALDTITEPIRSRVIFRDGRVWEWLATLITCVWCSGAWVSGAASLSWLYAMDLPLGWLALLWPAVSALVGMLDWLDPGSGD